MQPGYLDKLILSPPTNIAPLTIYTYSECWTPYNLLTLCTNDLLFLSGLAVFSIWLVCIVYHAYCVCRVVFNLIGWPFLMFQYSKCSFVMFVLEGVWFSIIDWFLSLSVYSIHYNFGVILHTCRGRRGHCLWRICGHVEKFQI